MVLSSKNSAPYSDSSHTSLAVWCRCQPVLVSVGAEHFFNSFILWHMTRTYTYLLNKIIIILQPFQQRLSLSNNKHIIYVYQESHRTASNSDLASSSSSKLRHVCRHHHHSVLITSQAREKQRQQLCQNSSQAGLGWARTAIVHSSSRIAHISQRNDKLSNRGNNTTDSVDSPTVKTYGNFCSCTMPSPCTYLTQQDIKALFSCQMIISNLCIPAFCLC